MESNGFASAILTTLPYVLQLEANYLLEVDRKRFRNENFENKRYDFVVVGGGTAGCVVAALLSKYFFVLLLEAGGDPPSAVSVPAFDEFVSKTPDINNFYISTPQKLANNRIIDKRTGKMLGGSGSHNSMIHNRGHPKDFDNWAIAVNDSSWNYRCLLKYFKKSETYMGVWPINSEHGRHGPITVITNGNPLASVWKKVAKQLKSKLVDPNGPQKSGYSVTDTSIGKGRRSSTYSEYIQPTLGRKTLRIIRYAKVNELIFASRIVAGVKYSQHGLNFTAYASKEVILCAGTFGSPLLLFRSGIGPRKMIRKAGVPLILNLPAVGKYLQDHNGPQLLVNISNPSLLLPILAVTPNELYQYLNHSEKSVFSQMRHPFQAFLTSSLAEPNWSDIHVRLRTSSFNPITRKPDINYKLVYLDAIVGRPTLRKRLAGTIKLNISAYQAGETDDVKLALINDKILKSRRDRQIISDAVKISIRIAHSPAFKAIGVRLLVDEQCAKRYKANSTKYWKCYITKSTTNQLHPTSTCRMGLKWDRRRSVVDSRLRVHGLKNLRIVDASVMPRITNANTNAPVIAIAEKTSDMILSRYR